MKRKNWIILALTVLVLIGLFVGFGLLRHATGEAPTSRSAATPQVSPETRPRPKGVVSEGKGSESRDYTHPPQRVLDTAERVVRMIVEDWSKDNGQTQFVSPSQIVDAGMSSDLAHSFTSLWETVFSHTSAGGPLGEGVGADPLVSISQVTGQKGSRVYELVVRASVQPWWTDRKGDRHSFPLEKDTWQVTYDEKLNAVTRITEPEVTELAFRIPDDLKALGGRDD